MVFVGVGVRPLRRQYEEVSVNSNAHTRVQLLVIIIIIIITHNNHNYIKHDTSRSDNIITVITSETVSLSHCVSFLINPKKRELFMATITMGGQEKLDYLYL